MAGVAIWDAKTGINQFMTLSDRRLLRRLKRFSVSRAGMDTVFGLSYRHLDKLFRSGLRALGLATVGYTFHSLRHGGATHAFLSGVPFSDIKAAGRWQSDKSCKRYLQSGRALLLSIQIPTLVEDRITQLSTIWRDPRTGRVDEN